ncbi:MAG TPA: hypothetical protein VFW13_11780 [Phenylobacterium sp.]|nr:hypothetical protein [Phenylobacterium sp.]
MRKLLPCLAMAALIGGPALAQSSAKTASAPPPESVPASPPSSTALPSGPVNPSSTPSPSSATPPEASTGASADTAANAGASTVMSGMSVKDSTGALIGEVKSVKNGEATIQMGSDTFTVDSAKLGVSGGVANINATQAELKKMLPPKK